MKRISYKSPPVVLTAAGLLLVLFSALYIAADTAIAPPTDSAHHLLNAQFFSRVMHLGGPFDLWQSIRRFYVGWPPATYVLLHGPLGWLVGDQSQLMRLYSVVLVPLLLWGTFRLGALLLADAGLAALAAVLAVLGFGVAGQLRQVSIDLPATAAVLLAMLALERCQGFRRPRWAMLLGAACGLCLLTRVQAVFFLLLPLLWQVTAALVDAGRQRRPAVLARRVLLVLWAGLTAMLVCSPWWYGRLDQLWDASVSHLDPARVDPRGSPGFWPGLVHYSGALGKLCGWPALLFALATLPRLLCARGAASSPAARLLLPWIIGGVAGCIAGVHREPRYLLPAVPAVALLCALGVGTLRRRLRTPAAAALILTVALPTLLAPVMPVIKKNPLVSAGVVEWAYVRPPTRSRAELAAREAGAALRGSGGSEDDGRDRYLLMHQHSTASFLPRMFIFLTPRMPELAYCSLVNRALVNSDLQLRERKKRRVYVISESQKRLDLPMAWELPAGGYGNNLPIRLYQVPDGSELLGVIRRGALQELPPGS